MDKTEKFLHTSRRALLLMSGAAMALPALPGVAEGHPSLHDWPHPEVGKPIEWRGDTPTLGPAEGVYVGMVMIAGKVIDPGRVYTEAEWAQVRHSVEPWVRRRNERVWREFA